MQALKQFDNTLSKTNLFPQGHTTNHALLQLIGKIYEPFERKEYTIGVFIDLSNKAFDSEYHNIAVV